MALLSKYTFDITDNLPITLQSLLMVWFAMLFGLRVGLSSVLLYLVAGGFGMEVFSGGASGWEHFSGSTGGFLLAFPFGALVAGTASDWLAARENPQKYIFLSCAATLFVAQLVILFMGLFWQNSFTSEPIDYINAVKILSPGLLIKTAVGTLAYVIVGRTFLRPQNH